MSSHLNLGSGQRPFQPPWINVDMQKKFNPDVVARAEDYLRQLEPESVDMICLHHVLEHYGCGEGDRLLGYCHRALKSGGSLLVFVPHVPKLIDLWLQYKMSAQLLMTNIYGAFHGDEADRHKWGYTPDSLTATLRHAGFEYMTDFDYRTIPGADIARDERWILGMEAVK